MEYREYKPSPLLSRFVECYWTASADSPPFREKESLIPDGTIEMMFNFGDDYSQFQNGQKEIVKGSHIIGIRKHSLQISQTSKQNFFSVRFKLGGLHPFVKIPIGEFANGFYEMDMLLGREYSELEEKLYHARDSQARIAIMEGFLLKKLESSNWEWFDFVSACSRHLLNDFPPPIRSLKDEFGTNYKTLERRFKAVMGLTPSELLKVKRFTNAVHSMYACRHSSLTEIGLACGYYDQSHFIREFRQLTNYSPREFLREQFTIVQVIQPALAERLSKSYNF